MSERPEPAVDEPAAGYTPDRLPVLRIGAWVLGLAFVLAAILVGLYQLFIAMAGAEVNAKELQPISADLVRQRDRDEALLGRYDVADEKRGRYRIPVTRAMELLAADPAWLQPRRPAASAPASAPAAAPPARGSP